MSYVFSIADESFEYTYNIVGVFRKTIDSPQGINLLDGMSGEESANFLLKVLQRVSDIPDEIEQSMKTTTATYDGIVELLVSMIKAGSDNPEDTWSVTY